MEKILAVPRSCPHKSKDNTPKYGCNIPSLNLKLGYKGCGKCEDEFHKKIFEIAKSENIDMSNFGISVGYHNNEYI